MSSSGSPYARFQRALTTGNLTLIRASAAELRTVDLGDALSICLLVRDREPERYERTALRWIARFVTERQVTLADARLASEAFGVLRVEPERGLDALRALLDRPYVRRAPA